MTNYKLDFSALTIEDMIPVLSHNRSIADILILAHKCVVGGVFHLSPTEITPIVKAVDSGITEWMASDEFMKMVNKNAANS